MAEARRKKIKPFLCVALYLGACASVLAQPDAENPRQPRSIQIQAPASGSLAGRLTDLHSAPLAGVSVVLRNRATGAAVHATTAKNGAFRFASLEAGEYTLEAAEPRLGRGSLEGILVTGGNEARVQAALEFKPAPPALLEADEPDRVVAPPAAASPLPLAAFASPPALPPPALSAASPLLIASIAAQPLRIAPLAAFALPVLPPRPVLYTSNPSGIASIAVAPLLTAPLAAHALPDHASALVETAEETPPQRLRLKESPALGTTIVAPYQNPVLKHTVTLPQRTVPNAANRSLETQPAALDPILAAALPRAFPLRPQAAVTRPALAAIASGVQAAIFAGLHSLSPIEIAARQTDPADSAIATTLTAAQLQALPASGRRWQEFLLDTPAAGADTGSSQPSFRASQESAEIAVDGDSTRLAFGATAGAQASGPENADGEQQSAQRQTWTGGRGFGVSEAAIREVTAVAGNVEARAMRAAGGLAGIRTESGANPLHGQGFLFDRQNTWGARNPYTKWVQNTGTAAAPSFTASPYTPPDREIVWGFGIGSHIRRDKLFWFAALDSSRRNDPGVSMVKHPSEFFQLLQPTSARILLLSAQLGESQNQAYNDYLGVPQSGQTGAGLEQLAGLLGPTQRTALQWTGFGRIDWQVSERHHLTFEGTDANWSAPGGGLTRVSANYGSHSFGSSRASQQRLLARWEAYLTPNLLAVTQSSAGRAILTTKPDTPSTFEQSFLDGNYWGQLPQIVVDSSYGFTIGNPARFGQGSYPDEKLYHAQEMLSWAHNKLLVRAGFEFDHNADVTGLLRNQTGTYHYSTVGSFISDALAFLRFGFADALDPANPHNCGATTTAFGSQPCYSYYSQTMGPTNWRVSTNDLAGYTTVQWQPNRIAVFSVGLRWEREQLPPPIATLDNPDLPLTEKMPSPGNNLGPRVSLAIGSGRGNWPVLRLGYGIYYGRIPNATLETALTNTGSLEGDLNFFMRPADDCQKCAGGAPPFPYVFAGEPTSLVKPGAVEFAPNFRNSEVHQALASIEQPLPGRVELTVSALLSLGRRLPISVDTNLDPAVNPSTITYGVKDATGQGPIKSSQITVPFYATWPAADCTGSPSNSSGQCGRLYPSYQQIAEIESRANSTYEAAMVRLVRYGRRGLSLRAHYTYAHAMDWNPNETASVTGSDVLNPDAADFGKEYGTSNLDVRHSATVFVIFESPWKLRNFAGRFANGWALSGIGRFRGGLPYSMRVTGSLPEKFDASGNAITGLGSSMNGSGGDNRLYGFARNAFRYPDTWKADVRLTKRFSLGESRQLEVMAESFNLFNHQNVTQIETTGYYIENSGSSSTLPSLCYLSLNDTGGASCQSSSSTTGTLTPAFGQPLSIDGTNFYRERQIQLGLRMRF